MLEHLIFNKISDRVYSQTDNLGFRKMSSTTWQLLMFLADIVD